MFWGKYAVVQYLVSIRASLLLTLMCAVAVHISHAFSSEMFRREVMAFDLWCRLNVPADPFLNVSPRRSLDTNPTLNIYLLIRCCSVPIC